jgi:amidase
MLLKNDPARAFMPYPPVPVARSADGPLSDLTFAVKDLFDVAGYPTSAGSAHMLAMSGTKAAHAEIVQTLLDAGARFVGKSITDELAFSLNGKNAHFGTPVNGGAPDRIPGGSSSGSASAVSHGMVDFALGTDTGGSVRTPASHCGLIGLRPTHGSVSLKGAHDLAPSFDTCGWFARDIKTFARVADVILGDGRGPLGKALFARDMFAKLSPHALAAFQPAIVRVEAITGAATPADVMVPDAQTLYWAFRYLQGREAWQVNGAFIERYHPPLGPGIRERFVWSKTVTDEQVSNAKSVRATFTSDLEAIIGDGVLILPTMPDVAPMLDASEADIEEYRNTALEFLCLAGLSGLPQLSLPLATRLGAPLGLSLIGPRGRDRDLISIAERIMG